MKRSECTVHALYALDYKAICCMESTWRTKAHDEPLAGKRALEVFEAVVKIVRDGGHVDIRRNNFTYEVRVLCDELSHRHGWHYALVRPMTDAERLEADLYTGRGVSWDVVQK